MKLELQNMGLVLNELPGPTKPTKIKSVQQAEASPSLGDAFEQALSKADDVAEKADKAGLDLMTGQIEIHQAMVRMEKADLMLKLGATVRSKVIDAYQQLLSSAGG